MSVVASVAMAGALGWAALTPPPEVPQTPVFRSGVHTVEVYPTVHDPEGRLVPDLMQADFTILIDGVPTPITVFSNEIQPITVALLLDMSGSVTPRFLKVRESAVHFIRALLPHDRVRIGTFGFEVSLSPLLTGDQAVLERIVREEVWPGGGTPLWNAAHAAMSSLDGEPGRRVVLIVSDGKDTGTIHSLPGDVGSVWGRARREGFMFYAVGMAGLGGLDAGLRSLVEETGGGQFSARDDEDLAQAFARVAEELRRQYVLGFTVAAIDRREHRIEVRARPGTKVRARRSFVAK